MVVPSISSGSIIVGTAIITSMSDTSVIIETEIYTNSLRGLMLAVGEEVGKQNRRAMTKQLNITLSMIEKINVLKETVPILEGKRNTGTETPITNLNPIDKGLIL